MIKLVIFLNIFVSLKILLIFNKLQMIKKYLFFVTKNYTEIQ